MKRVHRALALFTPPAQYRDICYAAELLPPYLLATVRQRTTRTILFVGRMGSRTFNAGERDLGPDIAAQVRQACLTVRTGTFLYLGSRLTAEGLVGLSFRAKSPVGHRVGLLLAEQWPVRTVADAVGVRATAVQDALDRWPRGSVVWRSNAYSVIASDPPPVSDVEAAEVTAFMLARAGYLLDVDANINLARLCNAFRSDPATMQARVLWAARARARLRQLGAEPPDVGESLLRRARPPVVGHTDTGIRHRDIWKAALRDAKRAAIAAALRAPVPRRGETP